MIGLASSGRLQGQPLKTLHNFSESEGWFPVASLALSNNILYGTTQIGGASNYGTVFKVSTDGTGFTTLHDFSGDDGERLDAGLVVAGSALCGTAVHGGSTGYGTVSRLNLDGSGFTRLHDFTGPSPNALGALTNGDGDFPEARLFVSGNTLYGTAFSAGNTGVGTAFKLDTDGTGFQTLHSFSATDGFVNDEGALPFAGLVLSGNTVYGTTYYGGTNGNGTIFALNTDGSGFRVFYNFGPGGPGQFNDWANIGGANPHADLLLSGQTLYGTAENGGSGGGGMVFKINTDGSGFATIHDFDGPLEGKHPVGGLVLSGATLYGCTRGEIFAVETNGTYYVMLHSFSGSEGSGPNAPLLLLGNTLYGTTSGGGSSLKGTVFSFFIPPRLGLDRFGENVVLSWATNAGSFTLQTSTNSAFTNWTTVSPAPVLINGYYTVTNSISAPQQFYRLSQ